MPLSNDFTNTRLSYLQNAIKNSKVVAQQFYPRFVREYNEQFPFTEPKMSNIGNPTNNSSVKGYLKRRSDEQIIEDLTTKIQSLTNDEAISREIVRALGEQLPISGLNYFDENFSTIQKGIIIPRDGISRQAFVDKVLMALRKEPYKSDISIYDDKPYITRPIPRDDEEEEESLYSVDSTPRKSTHSVLHDFLFPKSYLRDSIELPDQRMIDLRKTQKKNELKRTNDKNPLNELASKSEFIQNDFFQQQKAIDALVQKKSILPLLPEAIPVMEQFKHSNDGPLYLGELKTVQAYPAVYSKKGRVKGIQNYENRKYKKEDNPTDAQIKEVFREQLHLDPDSYPTSVFETYKEKYLEKPKTYKPKTKSSNQHTTRSNTLTLGRSSNSLSISVPSGGNVLQNKSPPPAKKGRGIQLEPLRIQHRVIKYKQVFNNNKYAIDIKKLKKNILDLKYVKNANHVATFQPVEISNNLKTIIDDIIKDHYNVQNEDFENLNSTEKRILKRLFTFLNIQNNTLDAPNDSIQQKFEVAYASFLAGNDNKELIKELSQYVKLALHENTISKKDGYEILKKLNK